MGYYIRILGRRPANALLGELRTTASPAIVDMVAGTGEAWEQLVLRHESGQEIAVIETNPVMEGELGAEELREFLEEVRLCRPESAAEWLQRYLPTVEVIYAFQLLSGTDVNDGWTPLHRVYNAIWHSAGGILQADGEGFSNEEGYTILWQFSDGTRGAWNVGVLTEGERWVHFEIDLGNPEHREAFRRGQVPAGVKVL